MDCAMYMLVEQREQKAGKDAANPAKSCLVRRSKRKIICCLSWDREHTMGDVVSGSMKEPRYGAARTGRSQKERQ